MTLFTILSSWNQYEAWTKDHMANYWDVTLLVLLRFTCYCFSCCRLVLLWHSSSMVNVTAALKVQCKTLKGSLTASFLYSQVRWASWNNGCAVWHLTGHKTLVVCLDDIQLDWIRTLLISNWKTTLLKKRKRQLNYAVVTHNYTVITNNLQLLKCDKKNKAKRGEQCAEAEISKFCLPSLHYLIYMAKYIFFYLI